MQHHQTFLRCSRPTAIIIITATTALFLLIGCTALFRSAGLTDEQAALQTAELKRALEGAATAAIAELQAGLAEGHDLKTTAVKAGSVLFWKILTAVGATAGVVLNGLLAKWLGTERKMSNAIITGVEAAHASDVKASIKRDATAAGVQKKLHARVRQLT